MVAAVMHIQRVVFNTLAIACVLQCTLALHSVALRKGTYHPPEATPQETLFVIELPLLLVHPGGALQISLTFL